MEPSRGLPTSSMRFLPLATLAAFAMTAASARAQVYVDANLTTGLNDGTSWANAYRGTLGLQVALQNALGGRTFWIARGTYLPSATGVRTASFVLDDGDELYGGFAGGETSLAQRDVAANPTILSGDLAGDDALGAYADNSLHVVRYCPGWEDSLFLLDGCTLLGGRADGVGADASGGALLVNCGVPSLANCTITGCTAGPAVSVIGTLVNTSIGFTGVRFEDNLCQPLHVENAFADLVYCSFQGNAASSGAGALGCGSPGGVRITASLLVDNRGSTASAVVGSSPGSVAVRYCTVVGNQALAAGVGALTGGVSALNSIVAFNRGSTGTQTVADQFQGTSAQYCCIPGGVAGTGNLSADPAFVDLAQLDLRLGPFSPCIDAGQYLGAFGPPFDFAQEPRSVDDPVTLNTGSGSPASDIGAYEYPATDSRPFCSGDAAPTHHATLCPCANFGAIGHGCASSAVASGAQLVASGTPAADDVVLDASDLPASTTTLFLQHDALDDRVFHDGVLCAGGTVLRLRPRAAVAGAARFPDANFPQDASTTLSQRGGVVVGSGAVRYYSVYYRSASSSFCPPATANVTNGWRIAW